MPASTPLATTTLGSTGLEITRVGFGAWAVGGPWAFGWGQQDDDDSVAAIRHAVESGVTWIDTAAVYGFGHSEEVVARALADLPAGDRPYLFTKGGMPWDEGATTPRRDPTELRREVEDSLRRLGVEQIDLYQVHQPPAEDIPVEDYWAVMLDLVKQGKVRAVGLSNHSVAQLKRAQALGQVDTLQPPFSAIARDAAADLLPWCDSNGTGVIVYSPMQAGLLSGSFSLDRAAALESDDWRRRSPDFSGEGLYRNLALADAMRPIAEEHDVSVAAVAVAWTLAWPGVSGAIVGARRPAQVDGWVGAGEVVLTRGDLDTLAKAMLDTGAGSGPKHPTGVTDAPGAGGHGPDQATLDAQTAVQGR